ncbi:MAG: hypothetical protein NTZ26_01785 [Candidatus Aminicenantes bacterium]|nr:hypothetical protein [Candidatus Aminicenantes bacterium]
MNSDERLDESISRLVRSVEHEVPTALDRRIQEAADKFTSRAERSNRRRPYPISEIRTEFEIAGKNIKVVFFQKPDFHLFEEERNEKD